MAAAPQLRIARLVSLDTMACVNFSSDYTRRPSFPGIDRVNPAKDNLPTQDSVSLGENPAGTQLMSSHRPPRS